MSKDNRTEEKIINSMQWPEESDWMEDEVFNRLWGTPWRVRQTPRRNFTHFFKGADAALFRMDEMRVRSQVRRQRIVLGYVQKRVVVPWKRPPTQAIRSIAPSAKLLAQKKLWDDTVLTGLGVKHKIHINSRGEYYIKAQWKDMTQ